MTPLEEARAELRELRASWEYAFARAHGCSYGVFPGRDAVDRREDELLAIVREHTEPA